jgi:transposase
MRYSKGFKASIVRKTVDGTGRSVSEIAKECGVHPATISAWIEQQKTGTMSHDGSGAIPPAHRHPGEKLALLLESKTVATDEMGDWLRRHGLHSEHLPLWEQELTTMTNDANKAQKDENATLRKENKRLQKENERQKQALVEAAILLTLKKKHRNLFEDDKED